MWFCTCSELSWIQYMLEQKTVYDRIKKFLYILVSSTDRVVVPINLFAVEVSHY